MDNQCQNCDRPSGSRKFCCHRCKWTWHNNNRTLTPNVSFECETCGKHVEKWVSPARIASGAVKNRFCGRTCAGAWRVGKNHPLWNGGRVLDKGGYWLVSLPGHPDANKSGYVREHRLVMEKMIGRRLTKKEVVHHINDDQGDNRPDNLQLYADNASHKAADVKNRKRLNNGRLRKK